MSLNSAKQDNDGVSVCIIVENCPLLADRRVWQEAIALTAAGYKVAVICPKGPGLETDYTIKDGIEIFSHRTWNASSLPGYIFEYGWAFLVEFWLALGVYRRNHFRVLQACNPPDNIFLIALFFKILFGVKFIFDHHDPCPELYETRAPKQRGLYWVLRLLERLTFRTADVTIATNDSIRKIATGRGGVSPERAFVVRTCPDMERFHLPEANHELKEGRERLLVYLGQMGPQDGLDLLLESIRHLIHNEGRHDTIFALIGGGPELPRLKQRAQELDLYPHVKFTGPLYGNALLSYLATGDVAVAPDPRNAFNDQLTMLKIMEYMACGIPIVQYDLKEGRLTAGGSALYAVPNDPIDFAKRVSQLLDSEGLRRRLSESGIERVRTVMNWESERLRLVAAYQAALAAGVHQPGAQPELLAPTRGSGIATD